MATKKIPVRMCVGCREMRPKKELVRIVRNNEGVVSVDLKGKAPGRGAYICPSAECLQRARKTKALERAFEQKVEPDIFARLESELTDGAAGAASHDSKQTGAEVTGAGKAVKPTSPHAAGEAAGLPQKVGAVVPELRNNDG